MGIRIDGNNDLINAADGSLTVEGLSINVTGIVTASEGYKVGSAYTVFSNGNVATSGIITATGLTVSGDISVTGDIKNGTSLIDITQNDRIEVDIAGTEIVDINGNGVDVFGGVDISGTLKLTDAIQHTGDTNTQIRFPAADTITAETAGTERLRIDSSGRLLLGTTTEGHSNADDLTVATSTNTGITIRSGTSNGGNIFFSDATSGTGEYAGMISYDHGDNILTFHTNDGTEKVRITSGGDVGITTSAVNTSQDRALTIYGTNSSELQLKAGNFGGGASGQGASLTCSFGSFFITNNNPNGDIHFQTQKSGQSTSEKMRITESGIVGINTQSSNDTSELLCLLGPSGDNATIGIKNQNTTGAGIIGFHDHEGTFRGRVQYNHNNDSMVFQTAGSTRFQYGAAGQFGIGGATYGSSGQVLTSQGSSSAPIWSTVGGGKVLQVVSQTKTDTASNSTGSGASDVWNYNVSDLRVQITAANANNKFLIMGSVTTASSASVHTIVRDDGTNLVGLQATGQSQRRQASSGHDQSDSHSASTVPIQGMITAGDTNQHTFHYAFAHTSGSTQDIFLNRGTNDGNGSDRGRYISTITVIEIEA